MMDPLEMHRPEQTSVPDLRRTGERETARRRRIRAAAWRALELAEAVFGAGVGLGLRSTGGGGRFGGIVHLHVPFRGLPDHRTREDVFVACAEGDPLLARTPLVFVFTPVPGGDRVSRPAEAR